MYFALLTFVIYVLQLTRDIYSGDTGDLVTAACVGGVPHPPGYPLFSLIGHALCSIPLPLPPVTRVALISAAAGALGVYFFYRFSQRITQNRFYSVLAAAMLAFSYLYWLHAEIPEVFGLHNLFIIMLLYFGYDYYEKPSTAKLYRLAAITGFALTHHQTILFIGPAIAILVFARWKLLWEQKRAFFGAIGIAVFAFLLTYLYVFISASKNPLVNWGAVENIDGLVRLIQRHAYGGFAPSVVNGIPIAVKSAVVNDYFRMIVENFSYQGLALAVFGGIHLVWKKKYIPLAALMVGWLLSGPLFIGYAATYYTTATAFGIIERFYSMSYTVFTFFIPFGLVFIDTVLKRWFKKPILRYALLSYFFIVPIAMLVYNHPKTDLSKTQIGNTLAFNILDGLPKNAVLFASGDTTLFNLWYARYVLNRRPDIDLINPPSVGNNIFLDEELNRYHQKHPKVPVKNIFRPALDDIARRRPIYATYDVEERPSDTVPVPRGLTFQMMKTNEVPEKETFIKESLEHIRKLPKTRMQTLTLAEQNLVTAEIPLIYSHAHVRIGDFLDEHYKDPKAAEQFYRLGLWRDEENSSAYAGLALALFKRYNDCHGAMYNINQAIDIYPVWKTFYIQRYIIAKRCKEPEPTLKKYREEYKIRFLGDLDEILKKQYKLDL